MKRHYTATLCMTFIVILSMALILFGCGGGGGGSGSASGGTGSSSSSSPTPESTPDLTGSVKDTTGQGVPGALVIVGASSKTAFTDDQGDFIVEGAASANQKVMVLAPGYRKGGSQLSQNQTSLSITIDEDSSGDDAPEVNITNVKVTDSGIEVNAKITSASDSQIVDARAELLGTESGTVLTGGQGNMYSGTISTSETSGVVMVFAVDDQGRHGEDSEDLSGGHNGSYTGNDEHWVGTVRGFHRRGHNYGRYSFNSSLDITKEGAVTGLGAFLRLALLKEGQSPLATVDFTGTSKATGKIYRVEITDSSANATFTLSGRVKSDGSIYTGSIHGQVDGKPYNGSFLLVNTAVLPNPWTGSALEGGWGISSYYKDQTPLTPTEYQYNTLLSIDGSGTVASGTPTTLGFNTASGASLKFQDVQGKNLGYFTGAPGIALDNGVNYNTYGFMGVGLKHVEGVWSSTAQAFGIFWGKRSPGWAASDFDAQWQGFFKVTGGPDAGQYLNAQVNINPQGEVTGSGSINARSGGSITGGNITIKSGTLAFKDTTVGGFTGSFSGTQESNDVTVNMSTPALPETASMGVYHARLIGQFEISTNGDTGYYFLFRNSSR